MWWQHRSICSLNVPSFQAHGQVRAQRSRQMDSLCGTQSCHICLEAERGRRAFRVKRTLKWAHLCGELHKCWPLSNHPSKTAKRAQVHGEEIASPFAMRASHVLSCRQKMTEDANRTAEAWLPVCPEWCDTAHQTVNRQINKVCRTMIHTFAAKMRDVTRPCEADVILSGAAWRRPW